MANGASCLIELRACLIDGWDRVACGALTVENGLTVGGGDLEIFRTICLFHSSRRRRELYVRAHREVLEATFGVDDKVFDINAAFFGQIHHHIDGALGTGDERPRYLGQLRNRATPGTLNASDGDRTGRNIAHLKNERRLSGTESDSCCFFIPIPCQQA